MPSSETTILLEVAGERGNQLKKWGVQRHTDAVWLTILHEETGEAARAILEADEENLRAELIQVAAVAAAWIEDIDRRRADRVADPTWRQVHGGA
jgi:NTP pyrophosphatase (non-canonical NTP hydrolase)